MATILHVSDYRSLGGAEVVFRDTVAVSRDLGHRTEVAVAEGRRNPISYVWSRSNMSRFEALLRQVEPDIIHLQNFYHRWSPSILGAIARHRRAGARLKVVMTAHDFHLVCPNSGLTTYRGGRMLPAEPTSWRQLVSRRYDRRSAAHSMLKKLQYGYAYLLRDSRAEIDLILSPSRYLADVFDRCAVGIPVEVVRNPISEVISAGPGHPASVRPTGRAGVVYFGRLTAEKGVVAAATELSRAGLSLDVYGAGEERDQLVELQGRDGNIRVHQPLDHDQMMAELDRYSVMIMPSQAVENAPLSVVEAALHGVKVVAARGSGAEEMAALTDAATYFDPRSPGTLVGAVREALANPALNRLSEPSIFAASTYRRALAGVYRRLSAELKLDPVDRRSRTERTSTA
jgi:glycosyltransferase involved in cell wall biosynthesis